MLKSWLVSSGEFFWHGKADHIPDSCLPFLTVKLRNKNEKNPNTNKA